jgi:hypothetical protein
MSLASDLDNEGIPPEDGIVTFVDAVTFVRMLPNLS